MTKKQAREETWKEFAALWKQKYGKAAKKGRKPEEVCFEWYFTGYIAGVTEP